MMDVAKARTKFWVCLAAVGIVSTGCPPTTTPPPAKISVTVGTPTVTAAPSVDLSALPREPSRSARAGVAVGDVLESATWLDFVDLLDLVLAAPGPTTAANNTNASSLGSTGGDLAGLLGKSQIPLEGLSVATLKSSLAAASLAAVPLRKIDLSHSPLRKISVGSVSLGALTLSDIPLRKIGDGSPSTLCAEYGALPAPLTCSSTLAQLESALLTDPSLGTAPLRKIDLDSVPLRKIDLASSPLRKIPLRKIDFLMATELGAVPLRKITMDAASLIGSIPLRKIDRSQVSGCGAFGAIVAVDPAFDSTTATLASLSVWSDPNRPGTLADLACLLSRVLAPATESEFDLTATLGAFIELLPNESVVDDELDAQLTFGHLLVGVLGTTPAISEIPDWAALAAASNAAPVTYTVTVTTPDRDSVVTFTAPGGAALQPGSVPRLLSGPATLGISTSTVNSMTIPLSVIPNAEVKIAISVIPPLALGESTDAEAKVGTVSALGGRVTVIEAQDGPQVNEANCVPLTWSSVSGATPNGVLSANPAGCNGVVEQAYTDPYARGATYASHLQGADTTDTVIVAAPGGLAGGPTSGATTPGSLGVQLWGDPAEQLELHVWAVAAGRDVFELREVVSNEIFVVGDPGVVDAQRPYAADQLPTVLNDPTSSSLIERLPLRTLRFVGRSSDPNTSTQTLAIPKANPLGGAFIPSAYVVQVHRRRQGVGLAAPYVLHIGDRPVASAAPSVCPDDYETARRTTTFVDSFPTTLGRIPQDGLDALFVLDKFAFERRFGAAGLQSVVAQVNTFIAAVKAGGSANLSQPFNAALLDISALKSDRPASGCSFDAQARRATLLGNAIVPYFSTGKMNPPSPKTQLQHVVLIGDPSVMPQASLVDPVDTANERDYLGSTPLASGSAFGAALARGRAFTDEFVGGNARERAVGTFPATVNPATPGPRDRAVFAMGRLVETPAEIVQQLQDFVTRRGVIAAGPGTLASTDFLTKGDEDLRVAWRPGRTSLSGGDASHPIPWTKSDLLSALGSGSPTSVNMLNTHMDHNGLLTGAGLANPWSQDAVVTTADIVGNSTVTAGLAGDLTVSVGCHSGLSVPDTFGAADALDWPQTMARARNAVYIANTGFGYSDSESADFSLRYETLFLDAFSSGQLTVGQAKMVAGYRYRSTLAKGKEGAADAGDALGAYDAKSLTGWTLYGLPMYRRVNSTADVDPQGTLQVEVNGRLVATGAVTLAPGIANAWTGGVAGDNDARAVVVTKWTGNVAEKGYILDAKGVLHSFGGNPNLVIPPKPLGITEAEDVEIHAPTGGDPDGGWVLYSNGLIVAFGAAPPLDTRGAPLWPDQPAKSFELHTDANGAVDGGWTFDGSGTEHEFGSAPKIDGPIPDYFKNSESVAQVHTFANGLGAYQIGGNSRYTTNPFPARTRPMDGPFRPFSTARFDAIVVSNASPAHNQVWSAVAAPSYTWRSAILGPEHATSGVGASATEFDGHVFYIDETDHSLRQRFLAEDFGWTSMVVDGPGHNTSTLNPDTRTSNSLGGDVSVDAALTPKYSADHVLEANFSLPVFSYQDTRNGDLRVGYQILPGTPAAGGFVDSFSFSVVDGSGAGGQLPDAVGAHSAVVWNPTHGDAPNRVDVIYSNDTTHDVRHAWTSDITAQPPVWLRETIADNATGPISLEIGPEGTLYASYIDSATQKLHLLVQSPSTTAWTDVGLAPTGVTSAALSVHDSTVDVWYSTAASVGVARNAASTPPAYTVLDGSGGLCASKATRAGGPVAIARLDGRDNAFYFDTANGTLRRATKTSGGWDCAAVDGSGAPASTDRATQHRLGGAIAAMIWGRRIHVMTHDETTGQLRHDT